MENKVFKEAASRVSLWEGRVAEWGDGTLRCVAGARSCGGWVEAALSLGLISTKQALFQASPRVR